MIKVNCLYCGKKFETYPYNLKIGKGKYCSLECRNKVYIKRIKLICKQCGKEFEVTPREAGRMFCSNRCHGDYRKRRIELICETCKKPFQVQPTFKNRRYCSKECFYKSQIKPKVVTKCLNCGKEVWDKPSYSEGKKFCSHKCQGAYNDRHVSRVCQGCGKKFKAPRYKVLSGRGKYCSMDCKLKYMKKEMHPAWKGGLSYEPYCSKFDEEFKETCREFWNRKCGICGRPESENIEKWKEKLSVHHVDYNKKSLCKDESNLFIPLCKICHAKTNHKRTWWKTYLTNYLMIWKNGITY